MSEKNEWKPIESAPKDGSEFLACYTRQGNVTQIVKWNTLHGYFASKGEWLPGFTANATHWMPLPAAPGSTSSAPGDAQDESIALDRLADYIADNWPDKKYSLEEICQRLNATWPGAFMPAAPAAGDALAIDLDRVLSIADEHAEESREDGRRVLDRGGLLALARDVLRVAEAPNAAGDALDAARYRALVWVCEQGADMLNAVCASAGVDEEISPERLKAIADAALAAQVPQQGEA